MVPMKAAAGSNHRPAPVIDSRREMRSKPEAPYLRSAEKMRRLEQALFTLTAIQRDVFRLSSRDGLAYPEIAERLSISVDAVEMHLRMAMLHLVCRVYREGEGLSGDLSAR